MNAEFFEALALLEKEKGISVEYLCAKIENAIIDKANVVPAGTELRGTDGDILYLKKN